MIKKIFISTIAASLCIGTAMAAERADVIDYFSCDFSNGFPEGTELVDADGAPLHFLMVQAGFDQGDSWKVIFDRSSNNYYAASPSMHTVKTGEEAVAANDRMTFPPVLIRGGSSLLTWRCRAYNEQSSTPSTYSILVDDTVVLERAEAPSSGWVSMDLSLDDYVGKRVNITFVNNTLNGEVLAIDDVAISGQPGVATVRLEPGEYALGSEGFRIGATFTASSDHPVTSAGVTVEVNSEKYTAEKTGLNLKRGESVTILVDHEFDFKFGTTLDYVITPMVNGENYDPMRGSTTPLAFLPKKRVVLEEGTGMWCGWCPLGIVATDSLKMHFGSDVIPIAIHFNDFLGMDNYAAALKITGAPYGMVDRAADTADPMTLVKDGRKETYTIWRGGFGTMVEQRLAVRPMADISAEVSMSANNKTANISCAVRFAADVAKADYKIALVMIEDDVWAARYYQSNYLPNYAERAPMGGFENMPTSITSDFKFKHVARAVAGDAYMGINGSLPASFVAGETHTFTRSMSVPSAVNVQNAHIVAMLINGADGTVVNACQAPLLKTGIDEATVAQSETVSINRGSVTVCNPDGAASASLYDLSGRMIATETDAAGCVTLTAPAGVYILRTATASKLISL